MSLDTCSNFLKNQVVSSSIVQPTTKEKPIPSSQVKVQKITQVTSRLSSFSFVYNGKEITAQSARDLMTKIFKLLQEEDSTFLNDLLPENMARKGDTYHKTNMNCILVVLI